MGSSSNHINTNVNEASDDNMNDTSPPTPTIQSHPFVVAPLWTPNAPAPVWVSHAPAPLWVSPSPAPVWITPSPPPPSVTPSPTAIYYTPAPAQPSPAPSLALPPDACGHQTPPAVINEIDDNSKKRIREDNLLKMKSHKVINVYDSDEEFMSMENVKRKKTQQISVYSRNKIYRRWCY